MKLKEIAIGYIEIPLVTPFKTALRTVNSVNDLIVKVTAEDGTEGYGEAPPTAVITGDTKESIEAAIRYYIAPSITGMDLDDLPAIMAKMEKCLAIDIGGSKVLVGVVDETGIVVEYDRKEYSSAYSLETLYADVKRMAAPYMEKYKPEICGVSLPGPVNGDTGVCPLAPFLGIRDWHAAEDLKQILGIPVYAENDANACAVAEKVFGKAADVDDFMWITVSNGVGGALYLNGSLYVGANFCAGEFGHIRVEEDGKACTCGKKGCLESVASGRAVSAYYKEKTGQDRTAKEIGALANEGDEIAVAAYRRAAKALGAVIASAATLLDVNVCYLGGGVSQSLDLFKDDLIAEINDKLFLPIDKTVKIEYSGLGYYASLCGAAAVAYGANKQRELNKGE